MQLPPACAWRSTRLVPSSLLAGSTPTLSCSPLFHAAGVPITVGSDAHVVTRVGENIGQAYALAAAAGYRSIDVPTAAGGWRSVSIA